MKLVREYINEKFTDDSDPIKDLGIGKRHLIEEWFKKIDKLNLKQHNIESMNYAINKDFTINVNEVVCIPDHYGNLPDYIKFNNVSRLTASDSGLTSLRGMPKKVTGNIFLHNNKLTSLKYAPKYVGGDFHCERNELTSLEYAPKYVGGSFYCHHNITKFTEEDIRAVCKVKGDISV
jgi:hypothetical protein